MKTNLRDMTIPELKQHLSKIDDGDTMAVLDIMKHCLRNLGYGVSNIMFDILWSAAWELIERLDKVQKENMEVDYGNENSNEKSAKRTFGKRQSDS